MLSLIAVLFTLLAGVVAEGLALTVEAPSVFLNHEAMPVKLTIEGGDLGAGEIVEVRTSIYRPHKRGPKFFGNLTHAQTDVVVDGQHVTLSPAYSLPTQEYLLRYSVRVNYEGELEWLESDLIEAAIEDPSVELVRLVAAVTVALTSLIAVAWLAIHLAPPGFWESRLPAWTHQYLPYTGPKKRV